MCLPVPPVAHCSCLSHPQVPQILNPVVLVIEELPKLYRDPKLAAYINATYGSCEGAQKAILVDFCRHAFDGSGADVRALGWQRGFGMGVGVLAMRLTCLPSGHFTGGGAGLYSTSGPTARLHASISKP